MKKLIKIVAVLVVLLIGVAVAAFFYIDTIAKTAIEKGSTAAMGVETKLDSVSLKVLNGQLVLGGLNVANPEGYKTNHFLNMKSGDVAVSLGSLAGDVVEVPHFILDGIDVNLEKVDGKANYQAILDNLKGSETDTKPESKEGKRFIVKHLSIKDVNVHLKGLTPVGGDIDVPIDEIVLENVGSESNKGLVLKDLSGVIVKAVFAAIVEKGGGLIPADIAGELTKGLSQLTDLSKLADVAKLGDVVGGVVGDVGKGVGDLTKNLPDVGKAGDAAKDAADKAKDALGGILGGKKKDK